MASDFFRARRFIGGGDRRSVSEWVWGVVRQRLRLDWNLARLPADPTPRLLLMAYLVLVARWTEADIGRGFSGERYGAAPPNAAEARAVRIMAGRELMHPDMPDPVRFNLPEWLLPDFQARFGVALEDESAAMEQPAALDLRANMLRGTRAEAAAALATEVVAPTVVAPASVASVTIVGTVAASAIVRVARAAAVVTAAAAHVVAAAPAVDLLDPVEAPAAALTRKRRALPSRWRGRACGVAAGRGAEPVCGDRGTWPWRRLGRIIAGPRAAAE